MDQFLHFFGRFHPLLVHFPVGVIVLAFVFDALSLVRKYRKLSIAVQPSLAFGTFAAVVSVITGIILSEEGGYTKPLVLYHQYAGVATTVCLVALLFARRNQRVLQYERKTKRPVRFFLFIPVFGLLVLTGHWGGSLTHGEEFLTEYLTLGSTNKADPVTRIGQISNPSEAVFYSDVIQPILESKCYSCHSASKQKGDLRLDQPEFIAAGGKDGKVIAYHAADSSSLYSRMMLPLEDEDHMPPNEKPQPSTAEIDLIRLWINEGAPFDKTVSTLKASAQAVEFIKLVAEGINKESWIPEKEVAPADESTLAGLKQAGVIVLPVGQNSNYLHLNLSNVKTVTAKTVSLMQKLDEQVVALRFSYCTLEKNLSFLNRFENLTWLYLDHTNVNDESFQTINTLESLKYLNIVFTDISEKSIDLKKFPSLRQLFTFESKVNSAAAMELRKAWPELSIDTGGVALPRLESDTIIYRKKS